MGQHVSLQMPTPRSIPVGRSVPALSPKIRPALDGTATASITAGKILAVLFDAACPTELGRRLDVRPFWAEEAMNRAGAMVSLVMMLQKAGRLGRPGSDLSTEHGTALQVASVFRLLDASIDDGKSPVAPILEVLIASLISLFGPRGGGFEVISEIEPMALAGYRRRGVILASSAFLCQALLTAKLGPSGHFAVSLERIAPGNARLSLENAGGTPSSADDLDGVLSSLARVLGADLIQRTPKWAGGVAIDLDFRIE
jgi:hypothetical protein